MSINEQQTMKERLGKINERVSPVLPAGGVTPGTRLDIIKKRLREELISSLSSQLNDKNANSEGIIRTEIARLITDVGQLSHSERERLERELIDDILGYGPLERYLKDEKITEIMVNHFDSVWIESNGQLIKTPLHFDDERHLRRVILRMVQVTGRRIDDSSPMVDARLPDGSRINAVFPPLAVDGPMLTIRKFPEFRFDFNELIKHNSITPAAAKFLDLCIKARLNILISGGTGSGKTTLLNALSTSIPDTDRIVTIEDAAELRLNQDHVLRLESRPKNIEGAGAISIRELVRNSLRMRPDRIIVGEVRGEEAIDMLQAMNTGHDGSLSTIHANTPRDALSRLETMVMMSNLGWPIEAIRSQIAAALDLIIQIERFEDGSRRLRAITEIQRLEGDVITSTDLFVFEGNRQIGGEVHGALQPQNVRPSDKLMKKFNKRGIDPPASLFMRDQDTINFR